MLKWFFDLVQEEKAQISVELIIILAAVVALVLLLVQQLQETSSEGTKVIEKKSKEIFKQIEDI
ncbi:MAG: hypothetical protein JW744_03080 [Candidatus Diapherotrites archaeon]|uniref:Class III signal peptide-containing protein n=1 Tax=Candidatus Iainarchaeum sp. TaxID=3101447 RepID=A0A938YUK7_9ARCH|nr:hypothetical protein [Candidatus Diapherotrites archaeon]